MKGEGEHIRLAGDKVWGDTHWLVERVASIGTQPGAQRLSGGIAAQSLVKARWELPR